MSLIKNLSVALLLVASAQAQFGPSGSSSSTSLGPAPTESIGCRVVDGEWQCAAPRTAAVSSTSDASSTSAAAEASETPSATTASESSGIPAPPAESTGCVAHGDHYHCEGPADGYEDQTPTNTAEPSIPSPTESSNCIWHISHWDCFDKAAEAEEAQGAEDTGECIIHVGHTHGDCSDEQLACGRVLLENYNMGLHIGAVFIVLVTSGLAVMIPLISSWMRKSEQIDMDGFDSAANFGKKTGWWGNIFFIARHFGTGIIISTAFIHLLFHGFVMFQNECVGELAYESTAPAIAMAAAIITFLLDFIGSRIAHRKHDGHPLESPPSDSGESGTGDRKEQPADASHPAHHDAHGHNFDAALAAEQNHQVLLLEAGIIFHSIMIGVTLGAGSGAGWTTLFIVIIFHQMFEGMALGARIAVVRAIGKLKAIIMAAAFTFITPIGIAIGIGVRQSFSQNGKASLLSVGILNSISAGILLYTAFKLLSSDFVDGPLRDAKPYKVFSALAAMVVGLIAMSVLGKWA